MAQFGGVAFRDQAFERNIDGIAVAEVLGAIRIGELHRLELQMKSGWRTGTDHARGVSLQNVQHLNQVNPAGRGRRHRDNLVAPIGSIYRITNDRRVIFEITAGHQSASLPDRSHDLIGDRTDIEGARAFASDRFQHFGEFGLNELVAQGGRGAIGL